VEFHGCNVAEGYRGEFFLIRFGKTFLKRNGGYVSGNNALYVLDGLLENDSVLRLREHSTDTHGYIEDLFGLYKQYTCGNLL
jgi:hypothetical protein